MKTIIVLITFLSILSSSKSQDIYACRKEASFSKKPKGHKKVYNIVKALESPESIYHLILYPGQNDYAFKLFDKNSSKFTNLVKLELFQLAKEQVNYVFSDSILSNLQNLEYLRITTFDPFH